MEVLAEELVVLAGDVVGVEGRGDEELPGRNFNVADRKEEGG